MTTGAKAFLDTNIVFRFLHTEIALHTEVTALVKQVHDANIVATMLAYGIDTLLTLNVDDLKRFGDRIKILSIDK